MKKSLPLFLAALVLAGCANSLDRADRISDLELPDTQTRSQVFAVAEADPEADPENDAEADPENDAVTDAETDAATDAETGARAEGAGFLAKTMQRTRRGPDDTAEVAPDIDLAVAEDLQDTPPGRRGLLSRLRGTAVVVASPPLEDVSQDDIQLASLAPKEDGAGPMQAIRGLLTPGLGPRSPSSTGTEADVIPGRALPFGDIARACGATKQDMGQRIEKGAHGFALYDSRPGATGPRNFFLTGFSDGCPRQFTAALAIFGAPAMHEKLRYGRPSEQYPYSDTDKAYEKVKSRICGVSRRQPCGARISRLERNTVFISTYERFTENGRWADILVHDGAVLAASLKQP